MCLGPSYKAIHDNTYIYIARSAHSRILFDCNLFSPQASRRCRPPVGQAQAKPVMFFFLCATTPGASYEVEDANCQTSGLDDTCTTYTSNGATECYVVELVELRTRHKLFVANKFRSSGTKSKLSRVASRVHNTYMYDARTE